jgi:hypothetical protein
VNRVEIRNLDDVRKILMTIAPREAENLMRTTTHDIAGQVAQEARSNMPRDSGDMIAGTKHKREKTPGKGKSRSTVRVRKAFYWRFLEYGDGPDNVEYAFFLKALVKTSAELNTVFLATFAKKLVQRLKRG